MPYLRSPLSQSSSSSSSSPTRASDGIEPIAICGMANRLPGSTDSPSALWKLLLEKKSTNSAKVPASRFNIDAHFHKNLDRPGSFDVLGGYFLDGPADNFDPTFFNMTPVEAMWLDPQQRKMLEVCYEAIESAGVTLDSISGTNTGIYLGSFTADYQQMTFKDSDFRHSYAATGVDPGIISNRIGNVFDLHGPSATINTACSSSIFALHTACSALRARDCGAALVGGVNLILTVDQHMNTAKLGVLSPTSFCHTYDESADGYGRAEGAGALYLKRLDDAMRHGDVVRAVIRSSAVNTNGKVPGYGITYPNVNGQERVIRQAYKRANLDPNDTAYVELHGTGTRVGDPIEVQAVSSAMNDTRPLDAPLIIGAMKPNIGHSEAASGIFAVIKAAMMVDSGLIPGVAGLKTVNPAIPEDKLNVKIAKDTLPWPEGFRSRRTGVSSFGYGGTNGHVIVENVEALEPFYQHGVAKHSATYDHSSTRPLLVTMSAHDKRTLAKNIEAHAAVVDQYFLADFAHTLNTRRSKFATRGFTIAAEPTASHDFAPTNFTISSSSSTKPIINLAFIFTGQGAQWATAGHDAMAAFPIFRDTIRRLDRVLKAIEHPPNFSIEHQLSAPAETSRINDADVAQPTLVAIQLATVDLLASWGVTPSITVGHSAGEYAAAYAAGLCSGPEIIIAAYYRGYALDKFAPSGGCMMAVGLGAGDELDSYLRRISPDIVIACENSPKSVTLSGSAAAVQSAKALFEAENIFARELRTGMAYHSPAMEAVAGPMMEYTQRAYRKLDRIDRQWRHPRRTMISSVSNNPLADGELDAVYWANNLTRRVQFSSAVVSMATTHNPNDTLGAVVEIGPHSALAGPFKQICQGHNLSNLTYIPTIIRNQDSAKSLLHAAGNLFLAGYDDLDLSQVNTLSSQTTSTSHKLPNLEPLPLVDLPTYQWNYEKTYFAEPRTSAEYRQLTHLRHDLLGSKILGLAPHSMAWRNMLRVRDIPWLVDHKLGESNMFPAAGHMALAIEAARQRCDVNNISIVGGTLRNFSLKVALIVPDSDAGLEIQTHLSEIPSASNTYIFTVSSCNDSNDWTIHSTGEIEMLTPSTNLPRPVNLDLAPLTQRHSGRRWNDAFRRVGFEYGRPFNCLDKIRTNGRDYTASSEIPITTESSLMLDESRYIVHPATVDSLLQLCIIAIHAGLHREMAWGVVPIKFDDITLAFPENAMGSIGQAVAWNPERAVGARKFNTNAQLATPEGKIIIDIKGLHTVAYEAALPPKIESEISFPPMPFAGVVWKPDIAANTTIPITSTQLDDAVAEVVDLLNHKSPLSSILILDPATKLNVQKVIDKTSQLTEISVLGSQHPTSTHSRVKTLDHSEHVNSTNGLSTALNIPPQSLIICTSSQPLASYKSLFSTQTKALVLVDNADKAQFMLDLDNLAFSLQNEIPHPSSSKSLLLFSLSSIQGNENPSPPLNINLIYPKSHSAYPVALISSLQAQGLKINTTLLEHLPNNSETRQHQESQLTLIYNPTGTILTNPTPTTFTPLKSLLSTTIHPILFLTSGVNEDTNPLGASISGFLRVLREEDKTSKLLLLDYNLDSSPSSIASTILKISTSDPSEHEYWLDSGGALHIPRIIPNIALSSQSQAPQSKPTLCPLPSSIYLLIGCLGGLGRSLTSHMLSLGARNLAFISRSGADQPAAAQLISSLTASGAKCHVFRGDASNLSDMTTIMTTLTSSGYTIKGVIHAAMVLSDGIFSSPSMTLDKFTRALTPKISGALALQSALRDLPEVDFFIMTSSISATVGQPGQSNYAAANSVLDGVALQRNAKGVKGTSLVLPMVLGVGVVAENDGLEEGIERRGMYGIEEREMLRGFEMAMMGEDGVIVLGLDPGRLVEVWRGREVEAGWVREGARFRHIAGLSEALLGGGGKVRKTSSGGGFKERAVEMAREKGYECALEMTARGVMEKCGGVLMLPVDGFEMDGRSVGSYGLDSMIGAELRNWLFKEMGLNIAFQDLLATSLSFKGLAGLVLDVFGIGK